MQAAVVCQEAERQRQRVTLLAALHLLIDSLSDLVPWLDRSSVAVARLAARSLARVLYLVPTTLPPQVPFPRPSAACVEGNPPAVSQLRSVALGNPLGRHCRSSQGRLISLSTVAFPLSMLPVGKQLPERRRTQVAR